MKARNITITVVVAFLLLASSAQAARIKDIGYINGLRPNQLIGYGLVVGLENTGDRVNTIFTNPVFDQHVGKNGHQGGSDDHQE